MISESAKKWTAQVAGVCRNRISVDLNPASLSYFFHGWRGKDYSLGWQHNPGENLRGFKEGERRLDSVDIMTKWQMYWLD